jgi:Spy/CpxP family protein refolding chaperone
MNRRLFTLLAATACSIFAQTPPAPPTPAQMAANMVAHIAVVLNLTTAQQASAITIFANAETTLAGIRANSRTAHDSLKAAIEANDTATIASVANQLGSLEAQQITVDATAHAAAYALLTADQKTKFAAIVGPGGLTGMGGPGHGPGPGGFGPPH